MTTYHLSSHEDDDWWRTISVVSIDGEPHAYQQRCEVGRPSYENRRTGTNTFSAVVVETEDHRLVPIAETVSDDSKEDLTDRFISTSD